MTNKLGRTDYERMKREKLITELRFRDERILFIMAALKSVRRDRMKAIEAGMVFSELPEPFVAEKL